MPNAQQMAIHFVGARSFLDRVGKTRTVGVPFHYCVFRKRVSILKLFIKVFRYRFFGDHASLLKSALRQCLSCRINVKFAVLFGFGLNSSAVYIL